MSVARCIRLLPIILTFLTAAVALCQWPMQHRRDRIFQSEPGEAAEYDAMLWNHSPLAMLVTCSATIGMFRVIPSTVILPTWMMPSA
jgi:hypothetical protein